MKDAYVVEFVKNLTELGEMRLREVGEVNAVEGWNVFNENSTREQLIMFETA